MYHRRAWIPGMLLLSAVQLPSFARAASVLPGRSVSTTDMIVWYASIGFLVIVSILFATLFRK